MNQEMIRRSKMVTTRRPAGARGLGHTYKFNVPSEPRIAAVLHREGCPKTSHLTISVGESISTDDGGWEYCYTEAEAENVADQNRRWRPGSIVTYDPTCCP